MKLKAQMIINRLKAKGHVELKCSHEAVGNYSVRIDAKRNGTFTVKCGDVETVNLTMSNISVMVNFHSMFINSWS